jgi:Fe-S cluster biogenesis protein NfuA
MNNQSGKIREVLAEALAPLVAAGGGRIYLSELSDEALLLHWAGRYAGSPASGVLHEELAVPLIRRIAPSVVVKWSSGRLIPSGAELIQPIGKAAIPTESA